MKPHLLSCRGSRVASTAIVFIIVFGFFSHSGFSQTQMSTTGNWDDASKWNGGNIGDLLTEAVSIGNNVDATIRNGFSYTVGSVTMSNNNELSVHGSLTIGANGTPRNLTTNNNAVINVTGTLIIWGDLTVNNNLTWNISGTVIIKGNVSMGNGAALEVSGDLEVDGNFNAGNNADVDVTGNITVGGNVNVGNNGVLTGCAGCFNLGGNCNAPSSFCSSAPLPVTILYLRGENFLERSVRLSWATSSELNFHKFIIERSSNGVAFREVGEVEGQGRNVEDIVTHYTYEDYFSREGWNYYRLRMLDFDLTYAYSAIVSVWFQGEKELSVHPNPASQFIHYNTNFDPEEGDRIVLINSVGRPILSEPAGRENTRLPLPANISPGLYVLKYSGKNREYTTRVIIR